MARRGSSGRLGRLARLGRLTTKVTGAYLSERVRDVFRDGEATREGHERLATDNAEALVETLGRLKGAAMKFGQSLAMAAKHLDLPEDAKRALAKLHAEAEPVPFPSILATLGEEVDRELDDVFLEIVETPLGTASLAQAHAATLMDGSAVVIKVLHEGVSASVETDLLAVKAIVSSGRALGRERAELDAVFAELSERLREELDYLHEAVNIQSFQRRYGDDPRFRIPKLYPSLCGERVLVMDRLPGVPLDRFLETASAEVRQRAGMSMAELFLESVFVHRVLHADPHPGNYLFEPDGRVGLLDYGCVKRFDEFWIASYARALLGALDGDREAVLEACRDLGAWQGDDPRAAEAIWNFCDAIVAPLREGVYVIGSHGESLMVRLQPAMRGLLRYPEVHGPRDIVFLHRTLGGMYTLARELRIEAEWGPIIRRFCRIAIDEAAGRAAG